MPEKYFRLDLPVTPHPFTLNEALVFVEQYERENPARFVCFAPVGPDMVAVFERLSTADE